VRAAFASALDRAPFLAAATLTAVDRRFRFFVYFTA
jgi:hypothetical protein